MSSIPDIGNQPIEHDPTGVRALLGALPDPGPMPADLVARIEAALAAQAALPEGDSDDTRPRSVIPFAAAQATRDDGILRGQTRKERRRVVLPWLAAAAAAGIVTVAATAALHDHGGSIVAAFRGDGSSTSAEMSSSSAAGSLAGGAAPDSSAKPLRSGVDAVTVMRTGGSYTVADLAAQAAALRPDPTKTVPPLASESPATGPYGTPLAVRDCASRHGVDPGTPLVADLGRIDGTPGFVVVAGSGTGRTAYAFSMTCTVLAGPLALP